MCDSPNDYIQENREQTDQVAAMAVESFAKLLKELKLDIPEDIAQLVAQLRESGAQRDGAG